MNPLGLVTSSNELAKLGMEENGYAILTRLFSFLFFVVNFSKGFKNDMRYF